MKDKKQNNLKQRDTHQTTDLNVQGKSIDTVIVAGSGSRISQGEKSSVWAAIGVLATVVGTVVALLAYMENRKPSKTPTDPSNPGSSIQSNPPPKSDVPAKSVADTTNINTQALDKALPPVKTTPLKLELTDSERQLLSQFREPANWVLLSPFVAPLREVVEGKVIEKGRSFAGLQPLLRPGDDTALDRIYLRLRQTNDATGEPWISRAVGPGMILGNYGPVEWLNDQKTRELLIEYQNALKKFTPVLWKAALMAD